MTPNKTTEQPTPGDFQKWAEDYSEKVYSDTPKGFRDHLHAELMCALSAAYLHLHSLPPSPVERKTKEEVLRSFTKSGGNTNILSAMQTYADQEVALSAPSPVGEAGEERQTPSEQIFAGIKRVLGQIFWDFIAMSEGGKAIEGNPAIHRMAEWVYEKYHAVSSPNPSRAGEISPNWDGVIKWLKDHKAEWVKKWLDARDTGYGTYCAGRCGAIEVLLEEAPPTPAPEVKEPHAHPAHYWWMKKLIGYAEDAHKKQRSGEWETRDTLDEYSKVISLATEFANKCFDPPAPAEPVKDTPVEEEDYLADHLKDAIDIADKKIDEYRLVETGERDWWMGYKYATDNALAKYLSSKKQYPTEQPAHVSDTNVGDIREDIMDWIHQHPDANYVTMHGVYTGFGPDYWAGVMRMYRQQLPVIAKLTEERDTARQDLQKMIDDLGAKMEEAADYRQAINSITEDCTTYLDCINVVKPLKRKYPSTDTKPTI